MTFLENIGFITIVILLALLFDRVFRNVKGRLSRRILGVVFMVVVATVIAKGQELYDSMFSHPTPIPTSIPIYRPTNTPRSVIPTATHEPCFRWDHITPSMNGKDVCVYGIVQSLYATNESWTRIRFTDQPNRFFISSQLYIFPDLKSGDCIKATGKVQRYEFTPYIETDELFYCEPWMETSS